MSQKQAIHGQDRTSLQVVPISGMGFDAHFLPGLVRSGTEATSTTFSSLRSSQCLQLAAIWI